MTARREQIVSALAGSYRPKVGHVGRCEELVGVPSNWRNEAVIVTRVSDSGRTVWFDFVGSARDTRAGVAWRRCWPNSSGDYWWAPWPRSALAGTPRVQLPAPKP